MNPIQRFAAAALVALAASATHAAAIKYEGSLALPETTVAGQVGGFGYFRENAAEVDFWSFSARAGDLVTVRGTRVDAALDPTLDVLFGSAMTVDDSLFRTGTSWGGMTLVGSSDDVADPPAGGPFGDPVLTFLASSTGTYTVVIGGSGSEGEGPFGYRLSLTAVQAVPEPSAIALMLAGIGGLAWLRRRGHGPRA